MNRVSRIGPVAFALGLGAITGQAVEPEPGQIIPLGANIQFFATTANLQKILAALETQQPYVVVANVTVRPVNAFRGFKPAPGQEPEVNVQLDVAGFAFAAPERK